MAMTKVVAIWRTSSSSVAMFKMIRWSGRKTIAMTNDDANGGDTVNDEPWGLSRGHGIPSSQVISDSYAADHATGYLQPIGLILYNFNWII
jgi:hypothetical protein